MVAISYSNIALEGLLTSLSEPRILEVFISSVTRDRHSKPGADDRTTRVTQWGPFQYCWIAGTSTRSMYCVNEQSGRLVVPAFSIGQCKDAWISGLMMHDKHICILCTPCEDFRDLHR
jgi:hypothetical protein